MEPPQHLPHLVVEDPKRTKAGLAAIAVVSFLMLSIPIGVYLIGSPQRFFSQASQDEVQNPQSSIELKAEKSNVAAGDEFIVVVEVRSDIDYINLAQARISYDPKSIAALEVMTGVNEVEEGYFVKEWLSQGFDNNRGQVILVGGVGTPGIVTKPDEEPRVLAKLRFVALKEGEASLSLDEATLIKNSDNTNSLKTKKNTLISVRGGDASGIGEIPATNVGTTASGTIELLKPQTGEVYFYFRPLEIQWKANVERISSINLAINGEDFANIASDIPNTGTFSWTPSATIPSPYITTSNKFTILIEGKTKDGKIHKTQESQPFGLVTSQNSKLVSTSSGLMKESVNGEISDGSKILSNFGLRSKGNEVLDLNGDEVFNGLDLGLLRKALLVKDLVL
jgi:hypothetical protein